MLTMEVGIQLFESEKVAVREDIGQPFDEPIIDTWGQGRASSVLSNAFPAQACQSLETVALLTINEMEVGGGIFWTGGRRLSDVLAAAAAALLGAELPSRGS